MPAGTSPPTKVMDLIKTAAAGVTAIGATRVFQGKKHFSESDNLEGSIRALTAESQGYFSFWLAGRKSADQYHVGAMDVAGQLLVHLSTDATTDFNVGYEVAEALLKAFSLESTFSKTKPLECAYVNVSDGLEDGIAEFDFALSYELPPICD